MNLKKNNSYSFTNLITAIDYSKDKLGRNYTLYSERYEIYIKTLIALAEFLNPMERQQHKLRLAPVINALTIVKFAEEQEKDKYCKGVRTKYKETIRIIINNAKLFV